MNRLTISNFCPEQSCQEPPIHVPLYKMPYEDDKQHQIKCAESITEHEKFFKIIFKKIFSFEVKFKNFIF